MDLEIKTQLPFGKGKIGMGRNLQGCIVPSILTVPCVIRNDGQTASSINRQPQNAIVFVQ